LARGLQIITSTHETIMKLTKATIVAGISGAGVMSL